MQHTVTITSTTTHQITLMAICDSGLHHPPAREWWPWPAHKELDDKSTP